MVLNTAIQLHQRDPYPREVCSSKELPYIKPRKMEHRLQSEKDSAQPLYIDKKLNKLKTMLPMASDAKLASLLVCEKGDMDAVVQHILEEPATEEEDAEPGSEDAAGQCSIIDLTGTDNMSEFETTRPSRGRRSVI
jgi:glutamine synthetase adenylyltransferase